MSTNSFVARPTGHPIGQRELPESRSLTDGVARILTEQIRAGELPSGSWLPSEQEMALHFKVSRTVVREAVSRLKSEGLVDTRQGKGAFVRPPNTAIPFRVTLDESNPLRSVRQLLELRSSIEPETAALAAERRSTAQVTDLKRALATIDEAMSQNKDGINEDIAFHLCIARATGNPFFGDLIAFLAPHLFNAIVVTRTNASLREAYARQTREEHKAIVAAVQQKDSVAARAAATRHMQNVLSRILSIEASTVSNAYASVSLVPRLTKRRA